MRAGATTRNCRRHRSSCRLGGAPRSGAEAVTALALAFAGAAAFAQEAPKPVRHDVAQAGREFLVLRHQKLEKGAHEEFYRLSRDAVWPFYEKIGARVVGQWQVVHPDGRNPQGPLSAGFDEGYRLARYRSYRHWAATRRSAELGGDGPDHAANLAALRARRELLLGSDGAIYLEGETRGTEPQYLPPLDEEYEPVSPGDAIPTGDAEAEVVSSVHPVRHGRASAGREIVTLRHFRIEKGSFEEFHRLSRDGVWPYFEKMGARVLGQWRVVHPPIEGLEAEGVVATTEPADYDEAYMMVRYASYQHWQATRPSVMARLGGDGLDYRACRDALERRARITLETSVRFLQGHLHGSPPIYLPALDERYRLRGEHP